MINRFFIWCRYHYLKMINSIAFYPAVIALGFLLLSILILELDHSVFGKDLKAKIPWISIKDADTARTIAATIAGGIISLTVFSFSMVMILLNQAASNMSNRILDVLIGNRFQQVVLGFYIGTIVYALFLLSTIRSTDSGIYVPAFSVYILISLSIIAIFLFIYFLHFVTQSVKFETVINRLHRQTINSLNDYCELEKPEDEAYIKNENRVHTTLSGRSEIFQGFAKNSLVKLCEENDWRVNFLVPKGTFIIRNSPFVEIESPIGIDEKDEEKILSMMDFNDGQPLDQNPYYGFHQLMEISLRALSPGINDPATAIQSLHALFDLLAHRLCHFPVTHLKDSKETIRVYMNERTFDDVFLSNILPIWDYGKKDRVLQKELGHLLGQLKYLSKGEPGRAVIKKLLKEVDEAISNNHHPS